MTGDINNESDVGELKRSINMLASSVSNLNVNVATQTVAIQGFKDLYELEVKNIHKEIAKLAEVVEKVHQHDLYIARTEAKIQTISGLIKAGWIVIGAQVLAFGGWLLKGFLNSGGGNG